eukprot:3478056-Amphidinium_carterae.1
MVAGSLLHEQCSGQFTFVSYEMLDVYDVAARPAMVAREANSLPKTGGHWDLTIFPLLCHQDYGHQWLLIEN